LGETTLTRSVIMVGYLVVKVVNHS